MICRTRITLVLVLTIFTIKLYANPSFSYTENPPNALVFSWKQNDFWYACGPIQCIKTGEKTEEKALNFVYNNKKETLTFIETKESYRIYSLKRPLKSYDKDVRKRLNQLGVTLFY